MVDAALRKQLERLRAEIARVEASDGEAGRALTAVAADIDRVLEARDPGADVHSLRERIEETALGFEASHPRFASVLREVTDALAKLGI